MVQLRRFRSDTPHRVAIGAPDGLQGDLRLELYLQGRSVVFPADVVVCSPEMYGFRELLYSLSPSQVEFRIEENMDCGDAEFLVETAIFVAMHSVTARPFTLHFVCDPKPPKWFADLVMRKGLSADSVVSSSSS